MINLGGLWIGTDKNGEKYMSGPFGNARIMVFKNKKKTKDTQPDYNVVIAESRKKDSEKKEPVADEPTEQEIPF